VAVAEAAVARVATSASVTMRVIIWCRV
jgi:hypothetical protein